MARQQSHDRVPHLVLVQLFRLDKQRSLLQQDVLLAVDQSEFVHVESGFILNPLLEVESLDRSKDREHLLLPVKSCLLASEVLEELSEHVQRRIQIIVEVVEQKDDDDVECVGGHVGSVRA